MAPVTRILAVRSDVAINKTDQKLSTHACNKTIHHLIQSWSLSEATVSKATVNEVGNRCLRPEACNGSRLDFLKVFLYSSIWTIPVYCMHAW